MRTVKTTVFQHQKHQADSSLLLQSLCSKAKEAVAHTCTHPRLVEWQDHTATLQPTISCNFGMVSSLPPLISPPASCTKQSNTRSVLCSSLVADQKPVWVSKPELFLSTQHQTTPTTYTDNSCSCGQHTIVAGRLRPLNVRDGLVRPNCWCFACFPGVCSCANNPPHQAPVRFARMTFAIVLSWTDSRDFVSEWHTLLCK